MSDNIAYPFEHIDLGDGLRLAVCLTVDGSVSLWFVVPGGGGDQGCSDCATHERLGPLPTDWQERVDALPVTRDAPADDQHDGRLP